MSQRHAIGRATVSYCALGALLAVANPVRANGAFPSATQLVSDPSDPNHLVLRSTFGLLVTLDAGATWDWMCEDGAGYKDLLPPMAVLPGGAILLAVPGGISRSDPSGCDFTLAAGISGQVLDVTRVPAEPDGVVAVSLSGTEAQLWRSKDGGQTFATLGDAMASFIPMTVDVATTDANVIYVSGLAGTDGALLRSKDGGKSFDTYSVPNTSTARRPFIAAVDPTDADTVYLRLDGEPSHLEVTRDGGKTFITALETEVSALGFALSPDGSTVIASNSYDGTFRADAKTLQFEKIACGGPTCLNFGPAGLFGCGDELLDGFIVGRSEDLGATFERVLDLSCIRGPAACGTDTSIGASCPGEWPAVQGQIGATVCEPPTVTPYTACFAAAAGANDGGATGAANGEGGALTTSGTSPMNSTGSGGGGCNCRVGHAPAGASALLLGVGVLARLRRRRREPHKPKTAQNESAAP